MKKNMFLRVASVLLVLTLLSTCAISGTFAKYVTSGNSTDVARVAKFGVKVEATSDSTFAKFYKDAKLDSATAEATVVATENVVAPGTNGALAAVKLTGKPEVDVKVTYEGTLTLANWEVDGSFYCPIVFNVAGTEIKQDATNDTAEKLQNAVNDAIKGYSKTYDAGTDLSASAVTADALTITWNWAYTGDDAKDTKLGDATTAATINLAVTTTVTQID